MTKNRKDLTPRRISRLAVRPKPQSTSTANIKVVIRVRPANANEDGDNQRTVVKCRELNTLTFDPEEDSTPFFFHGVKQKRRDLLKKQHKNLQFIFDRVFSEEASNEEVFRHSTKELIDILMAGCNCSVFVYGATGAGKTYTMLGKPHSPGITVLTMSELFTRKAELSEDRNFELFVTYLEVYNENVRDLLKPGEPSLQLREDGQFGVRVPRLTHKKITNAEELFVLLEQGNKNRTQHPTDSNAESSRSHAVFQVYIKMTVKTTGQIIMAKLSMIDLAGSERGAATGCRGMRFTEGANINKSLLALGNCINSLADGQRHVPYRDSKLTRILKDSLGGNCHTVMIANVSPSSLSFEDTYNTLKYANRAKKIKSNVKKNVVTSEKSANEYIKVIEELNEEIRRLKEENQQLKSTNQEISDKQEITVNTTITEVTNKTFTTVSTTSSGMNAVGEETMENEKTMENVKKLFEHYGLLEQRRHQMIQKKYVLEMRIDLKDDANNRLSGFSTDTPDKENGHTRLVQKIDRLRRQTEPFDSEIKDLENKIFLTKTSIDKLVDEHPDLKIVVDAEQNKIELLKALNDKEMVDSMHKIQSDECRARGELLEKMTELLKPWFLLLKSRDLVTDDMTKSFQNLRTRLLGYCNVKFEDGGDSGLSTSSGSACSSNTEVKDEQRTFKRKINGDATNEMNTTFVCQEMRAKTTSESVLFKEYHPSPPKRPAKCTSIVVRSSPRILKKQKENSERRPIGTMGTASRFPTSSKLLNQQAIKRPFR